MLAIPKPTIVRPAPNQQAYDTSSLAAFSASRIAAARSADSSWASNCIGGVRFNTKNKRKKVLRKFIFRLNYYRDKIEACQGWLNVVSVGLIFLRLAVSRERSFGTKTRRKTNSHTETRRTQSPPPHTVFCCFLAVSCFSMLRIAPLDKFL